MAFDDLFDLNKDDVEQIAELREDEIWDTGNVWSTGQIPKDIWIAD